jgi:hypothetical protein
MTAGHPEISEPILYLGIVLMVFGVLHTACLLSR